ECPNESFKLEGIEWEFKIFFDELRNWTNAKKKCEAEFMSTAHPSDKVAVKLRKHLLESCGYVPVWLNARSDGTKFVWQDTKTEIHRNDDLWLIGDPTSIIDHSWHYLDRRISIHYCLNLEVFFDSWSVRPRHVYASRLCAHHFYTLCEVCPEGFFSIQGSQHQCFKLWNDERRSWKQAQSKCVDENSVLAAPADDVVVALRQHIVVEYG
ncbi:unnamed protein product, partial [Meganyctiphanes norvegica]